VKHKYTTSGIGVALAAVFSLGSEAASAAGFALHEQNASGLGNAYAGAAAVAEDASTIFFNPAGMGLLPGPQVVVAGHAVNVQADFHNRASSLPLGAGASPVGATDVDAGDLLFIPNLYFAMPIGERFAFGIGANAPFGLKTEYDDPWIGRYQGIKSELKTVNINPAISYKLSNSVILGAGVNYQKADVELTNAVVLPGGPDGRAKLEVDDDAWGWNIGALFIVSSDMRIGVNYRSKLEYDLEGDTTVTGSSNPLVNANASGPTRVEVTFPDSASLSVVQNFGPQWQLLGDVTWTHWSELGTLRAINTTNGTIRDVLAFELEDAWRVSFGTNYIANERWTIRAGVAWDETPVQDQFRTVRLPDEDRYWVALGAKWNATKNLAVDFGYSHLFISDPEINLTRSQVLPNGAPALGTASTVNGTYDSSVDIFSIQVAYTFR
jgi:long-chain fatty acid transport protein